jgi:hypothetical protein
MYLALCVDNLVDRLTNRRRGGVGVEKNTNLGSVFSRPLVKTVVGVDRASDSLNRVVASVLDQDSCHVWRLRSHFGSFPALSLTKTTIPVVVLPTQHYVGGFLDARG